MLFQSVADVFYKLSSDYHSDIYRSRAYKKAANILNKTPHVIVSRESLAAVGLSKHMIDKALNIIPNAFNYSDLMKIPGIGVVKANQLIAAGVTKLSQLSKFNHLLPLQSKLYILLKPIAAKHSDIKSIESTLSLANSTFAGSYRRNKAISNDIDIVTTMSSDDIIDVFKLHGKCYIYARGTCKISMYFNASKIVKHIAIYKIDLFLTNKTNYASMILYATGSKDFNVAARQRAKELGYLLNQNGLFRGKKQIMLKSERDYFDKLQMQYLQPSER